MQNLHVLLLSKNQKNLCFVDVFAHLFALISSDCFFLSPLIIFSSSFKSGLLGPDTMFFLGKEVSSLIGLDATFIGVVSVLAFRAGQYIYEEEMGPSIMLKNKND